MVDPIKGSGSKPIAVSKPQAKKKPEKTGDGDFDKRLAGKEKAGREPPRVGLAHPPQDQTARILNQQHMVRMQRLADITRQIQDGTYKMADPEVLAGRILSIITDGGMRDKFVKKVLAEEAQSLKAQNKTLTKLELKKLIFLVKNAPEEEFSDAQLDALLKELT